MQVENASRRANDRLLTATSTDTVILENRENSVTTDHSTTLANVTNNNLELIGTVMSISHVTTKNSPEHGLDQGKVFPDMQVINNKGDLGGTCGLTNQEQSGASPESAIHTASNESNETNASEDRSISARTSQSALAFTIDFADKEVDSVRYHNLFERYNARHKRNSSMSKVEIRSKKSMPVSSSVVQKPTLSHTHSEGYFSSDQEENIKRKADRLSQKLHQLGLKSPINVSHCDTKKMNTMSRSQSEQTAEELISHSNHGHQKSPQSAREKLSLDLKHTTKSEMSPRQDTENSITMNNLSRAQTSSNLEEANCAKYSPEKKYTKNIECKEYSMADYDHEGEDNLHISNLNVTEKISNKHYLTNDPEFNGYENDATKDSNMHTSSISCRSSSNADGFEKTNLDVFNVSNLDGESDGAVSEAGTYTIHKDYTDEEKARMDIDKVFSVGVLTEEESNEAYVHSFKLSVSRDNNTWISEWATQVAEHNSFPSSVVGKEGRSSPLSPSKIPSPIHTRSQRLSRNRQEQSDSSLDTESCLRANENLGLLQNRQALIDSGGESDDDTSNSYNTPPHSSQRTPTHNALIRRGSLSEALLRRVNASDVRRSIRKYINTNSKPRNEQRNDETVSTVASNPSHALAALKAGRRSSSLDRKQYMSDTAESATFKKNDIKYSLEDNFKLTSSPVLNRLQPSTPKLTNSPILSRKELATRICNSPVLSKARSLTKSVPQANNIGYFVCTENSPYMLRKSSSTTNYHEDTTIRGKELSTTTISMLQNSPVMRRSGSVQRSSSSASIRNVRLTNALARHSSFNNSDTEKLSLRGKFAVASDSSSETGEAPPKLLQSSSSGIKLNRAFSIRRARLNCESDTTPNTTPEERRKRTQVEVKPVTCSSRQQSHHRRRMNSIGSNSKEVFKKPEPVKSKTPSTSRTDSGRFSMWPSKSSHHSSQRPSQKPNKDQKSGRSNSTLTSKEVEFQNWKRRKNYDPMKAAAEGKKKLDNSKKTHSTEDSSISRDNSVLRSASFHGTGGTLSLADDWSDNEIDDDQKNIQAPPPCSPQLGSDSDLETSSYLQTTQNVVSAMSARITVYNPALVDSGGESDEDTSHSLHRSADRPTHQESDTESSDGPPPAVQPSITNTKYNRAFSLRRARLEPQETKSVPPLTIKTRSSSRDTRGKPEAVSGISRTDSGRFSMRLPKSSSTATKLKSKEAKKPSTPSSKEVEMQNWKRRKSYDPMKAALEGRRKAGLAKRNLNANVSPRTDSDQ
ncbi:uncharacterized protein LOC105698454 isoform X2 [Orussus abietinus]|uniref:uncharacterized protein LOC105698454 isoform X2 n=1 Tax=Orussus abietinus TaxID=222816 RepID=UPI0006259FCB|nr:uncharacterized protein LOC105698454 isoform X2 [Orussus abietinus]